MDSTNHSFQVGAEETGNRLDVFLVNNLEDVSRNRVQSLIKEGMVTFDDKVVTDRSHKVKEGRYKIQLPPPKDTTMKPANIPLDIVFEDADIIVVNKQAGLSTHPGAGNHNNTLANALVAHAGDSLSGIGGVTRPGIVHRLDKDTTGLLVVAKNDKAHQSLSKQIASREAIRIYNALCWESPSPLAGRVNINIDRSRKNRTKMAVVRDDSGREAITNYKLLRGFGAGLFSLIECKLETGRTHQIRVHMSYKGHPIVGDQDYCNIKQKLVEKLPDNIRSFVLSFSRQALHAKKLCFIHPTTEEFMEFETELPPDMQALIKHIEGLNSDR